MSWWKPPKSTECRKSCAHTWRRLHELGQENAAHAIFQRLLNRAKSNKEDFNLLLSRYGMERFLYRLSVSPHNDRFILKGASLFLVWKGQNYRVTRDADFLGFGNADIEQLANVFRDICRVAFRGDGMSYRTP